MVRHPDESQRQNADVKTHASGSPSTNGRAFGLVGGESGAMRGGFGGRFASPADEDSTEEESCGELEDYVFDEGDVPGVDEEIDPKNMIDSSDL